MSLEGNKELVRLLVYDVIGGGGAAVANFIARSPDPRPERSRGLEGNHR
jgi:hypothetical protein